MRRIDYIVIHCSDSPDSMEWIGVKEITEWHIERGFQTIGYHYVVLRSGVTQVGRPETSVGAHVKGFNENSIGLCWVGRDYPTTVQHEALIAETCRLVRKYPGSRVVGHRELAPLSGKTCPNIDMKIFREEIQQCLKIKLPS